MESPLPHRFRLGAWLVEPSLNRISRPGTVRQLDPRLTQVLLCLSETPGQVVRREELLDQVWRDVVVSENTISSAIARLRKLLGDDWQNPSYIETISKSGYRLIAPVRHDEGPRLLTLVQNPPSTVGAGAFSWGLAGGASLIALTLIVIAIWPRATGTLPTDLLEARPLLTLSGEEHGAVLSPDGRHVAFAWRTPDRDAIDVYVQLIGEPNAVRFTDGPGPAGLPAWSPDGASLAFAAADTVRGECGLYRKPLIGGQRLRIGSCPNGIAALDWSPDGSTLVMTGRPTPAQPAQLGLVDVGTGVHRPLLPPPTTGRGDVDPHFSPDGSRIAFRRFRPAGGADLFTVSADGSELTRLTFDSASHVQGVTWLPDGRSLLITSNREGRYRLWRVTAGGDAPTRLAHFDHGMGRLHHARGAGRFLYRSLRDESDLWQISLDSLGLGPSPVLYSSREDIAPAYSPDGHRIAFASRRSGQYEIWSGHPSGQELIQHTAFDGAPIGAPRWSPDASRIVFDASTEGHADLWQVPADGRNPSRLTSHPADEVNPRYSPDGSRLYFASNRTGRWEVWRMPVSGGSPRQITRDGGFDAWELGDWIWFSRIDSTGIWRMPRSGGSAERITTDIRPWHWGSWAPVGDSLIFVRQSGAIAVQRGAAVRDLYRPEKRLSGAGPAITLSPDGRSIVFARVERSDDEVMLVDY
ncbi:MAG: PD40 domain-containing protein [Rhodothermales bacterium]|nr:PD40 domain-containing protein [Rhodothermales bacterium]MBO6781490.1 PD40 domain-containing protein [Rhodothermales bacterium]